MDNTVYLITAAVIIGSSLGVWSYYMKKTLDRRFKQFPAEIYSTMRESLLAAVRGDLARNKGTIGELAAQARLMSEYDSLVPDGRIADFIAIKLPSEEGQGSLDFIEVKTGMAKTSKFQDSVKEIIQAGNVRYIEVRMQVKGNGSPTKKITDSRGSE